MSFYVSDVFDNVPRKFDLIVIDPPFRWFKARDQLELSRGPSRSAQYDGPIQG
jgi:16S rRNA G1207 methylase RsmC